MRISCRKHVEFIQSLREMIGSGTQLDPEFFNAPAVHDFLLPIGSAF